MNQAIIFHSGQKTNYTVHYQLQLTEANKTDILTKDPEKETEKKGNKHELIGKMCRDALNRMTYATKCLALNNLLHVQWETVDLTGNYDLV